MNEERCPYWAHRMMAGFLASLNCEFDEDGGHSVCQNDSRCITEYCAPCYASLWLFMENEKEKGRSQDLESNT
jgi:hypothetical protein